MPTRALPRDHIEEVVRVVRECLAEGFLWNRPPAAIPEAGKRLGLTAKQVEHRLKLAVSRFGMDAPTATAQVAVQVSDGRKLLDTRDSVVEPTLPDFPDDGIPVGEIIDLMCRRYERRAVHRSSKQWFRISMPDDGPFALMWWGDPHLDNNGTNFPLIRQHAVLAQTPHVYSVNIGDTLDNWPHGSRLIKLYADSDQSVGTAQKLARWFIQSAGIRWLVWLQGNHDSWGGHTTTEFLRELVGNRVVLEDWGAKFVLACPNGHEYRVWASHNFPGHSQWNSLHGPQKAASMRDEADIYVCGHTHNWAIHKEENAQRGFTYSLIRARGYKYIDSYGEKLGYPPQQHGASIVTVFVPERGRHYSFEHVEDGLEFLRSLREIYERNH